MERTLNMNYNMFRMLAALGALGVPMAPREENTYEPYTPELDTRSQDVFDKAQAKRERKNAARLAMVAKGALLAVGQ